MKEIINKIKNKKKKKGFTLVELLAVIVILAIIMILTIPTVLNNVGEAKKKSFETVGKTLMKYIDDNYQNCKLGNKDIAKYDESLFDENTCDLKTEIKEGENTDWINNAGYSKEEFKEVKVKINSEEKVEISVKPSNTGEYKDSEEFTTIALNYDPSCWNYSGSTINGFIGLDSEGNIYEKCNGFIEKDSDGLYHLDIPGKIGETTMTEIGMNAFAKSDISFVSIPESITIIGANAFSASMLKEVVFDSDSALQQIGIYAFRFTQLEKVNIPASVTLIGISAFGSISTLKEVNFEKNSNLKNIGTAAFSGTSITTITIPASVQEINVSAFVGLPLKEVKFEENSILNKIDMNAFNNTLISSIVIPPSVTIIGNAAFNDNPNLTTIEFCGTLTAGNNDWYDSSVTTVTCPEE